MNKLAPSGPANQVVINDPTQETVPPVQHHVLQGHEEMKVQKSLSLASPRADDVTDVLLVNAVAQMYLGRGDFSQCDMQVSQLLLQTMT